MTVVLAVDPGQEKCGIAVVSDQRLIDKRIVSRNKSVEAILSMADQYEIDDVVIGDGTGSEKLRMELAEMTSLPIIVITEAYTTIKARKRYFIDNPRKGIRRLIPVGMLIPEQPYDDYAALIIAEEYLQTLK